MTPKDILVIVGPTASGKSELAVHLAQAFNGEVISADSRQVYKGLDIGTGKITKPEMRGVPHHLLDIADPKKQFSASDFLKKATEALSDIHSRKRLPIIAGGTGFYIDSLTGIASLPEVPPNPKLRARLSRKTADELFVELKKKDPRRAKTIDQHNKVRLIRALEIVDALGKVPETKIKNHESRFIFVGLNPDNLDHRIGKRLKKRLPGIIQEAKKLIKLRKLTYKRMDELGLEYRYIALYLQGKLDKKEMQEKLFTEIRRYAKRQMTWFKRNKNIKWFKTEENKIIERYLRKFYGK